MYACRTENTRRSRKNRKSLSLDFAGNAVRKTMRRENEIRFSTVYDWKGVVVWQVTALGLEGRGLGWFNKTYLGFLSVLLLQQPARAYHSIGHSSVFIYRTPEFRKKFNKNILIFLIFLYYGFFDT